MNHQLLPFYWKPLDLESNTAKRILNQLRRNWRITAKLTDALYLRDSISSTDSSFPQTIQGRILTESELKPGELSAVTFRVGTYIVRSALRVYSKEPLIHCGPLHKRIFNVANPEEVDYVKKSLLETNQLMIETNGFGMSGLYVFHEISARPISAANYIRFKEICKAECFSEEIIETICVAKASCFALKTLPSLFVCHRKPDCQRHSETWVRFDGSRIHNTPSEDQFICGG